MDEDVLANGGADKRKILVGAKPRLCPAILQPGLGENNTLLTLIIISDLKTF